MKPSQVAIDFGTPQAPPSRASSSDDFEKISYPSDNSDWNPPPIVSSYNKPEEELPLHYMNEDKARRRVVGRGGGGEYAGAGPIDNGGDDYYDDEGKDVYSKIRPDRGRVGSGRLRRAPPPPPTSIVCVTCSFISSPLTPFHSVNSFSKTSNTSLQQSTLSSHAGHASTKSATQASSSGTKHISVNSAHTTSSASSTSMSTPLWERCSLASLDCCQVMMAVSSSRAGRSTEMLCLTSQ